jgi:2-polyprenyl-6-methoxyphenol hydroxylase-like FAD-dependent oxidoreductase
MNGLQFKRRGCTVTILEKDRSSERASNEAGVGFRGNVRAFLDRYGATGLPVATPAKTAQIGRYTNPRLFTIKSNNQVTSWDHFYRILRANFDGFAFKSCPNPPPRLENDGQARYVTGKRVTGLEYSDGIVTVRFVDVVTGEESHLDADFVIGADGLHSTVRRLIRAPAVK